jgi:hypothetical protein
VTKSLLFELDKEKARSLHRRRGVIEPSIGEIKILLPVIGGCIVATAPHVVRHRIPIGWSSAGMTTSAMPVLP